MVFIILQPMIREIIFLLFISFILAAECHGKPGEAHINSSPIWNQKPRFLNKTTYGSLYEVGNGTTTTKLIHVYGNMYQMGLAHGILLKEQLLQFMPELWTYLSKEMEDELPAYIPKWMKSKVSSDVIGLALDMTYYATRPYTNKRYYQELKGIADGSGASYKIIRRMHMIGEFTKGTCSMFGAWGNATVGGKTIQLRTLDWDFDGPFRKYPLIVVYHPSSPKDGNDWVNVGFMGWAGVISGMNNQKMAVSQIGVYFKDDTYGQQSRIGNPFTFVLRDVLQFDKTLNESIHRMQTTRRTCSLILGVGDGKEGSFRSFQYSHTVLNVISDTNLAPVSEVWHPPFPGLVYYGMDWMCPTYTKRMAELLDNAYGDITPELTISYIMPGLTSGNLQAVVYDLTDNQMYIAYGYVDEHGAKTNAYDRSFIQLDLPSLFATKNK